nr:gamma-glutamylcyclotransferase family protein [Longimicrobium terrae]
MFVYGTLRPDADGPMHRLLAYAARRVGPATAAGALYDVGPYPAAVPSAAGRIRGELLALNPPAAPLLAALDAYEGFSPADPAASLYVRSTVTVRLDDGGDAASWVYWYARPVDGLKLIASGDWMRR